MGLGSPTQSATAEVHGARNSSRYRPSRQRECRAAPAATASKTQRSSLSGGSHAEKSANNANFFLFFFFSVAPHFFCRCRAQYGPS